MNIISSSLAGILMSSALVSNVYSSESLAKAIQNSEVSGVLRQVWREKNYEPKKYKDGFSIGGRLEVLTDEFYGLRANVGFQISRTPDIGLENNDSSFSQHAENMHLANLLYTYKESDLTVGRFFIKTPLVKNRSSRILKDYFDGAYITNTSLIPETEIIAGVIKNWQEIDQDEDNVRFDKPVYTIYLNSMIDAFELTGQATFNSSTKENKDDASRDYLLEILYSTKGDYPLTLGVQYIGYDDKDNDDASDLYGLMAKVKIAKGFSLGAHYTRIADEDGEVRGGYGESSDPSWNSMIITDGNEKGIEAYRGTLYYKGYGLKAEAYYAEFTESDDDETIEYGIEAKYKCKGKLKGLSFETKLATADRDGKEKRHQYRFYTQYKF